MWRAKVLTLFPEMFPGPLGGSLAGRALEQGLWSLEAVDIRAYARDKHRSVDDTPLGGGPGMVMRPDVVGDALGAEALAGAPLIYLTPRGRTLDQERVRRLVEGPGATLLCGRFEGVDQRVVEAFGMEELSVGDFVLSGGEIAAMVVLDACVRLLPGVMGAAESLAEESFERVSPLHAAGAVARGRRQGISRAGGAAVGTPREGAAVAAGAGEGNDARA